MPAILDTRQLPRADRIAAAAKDAGLTRIDYVLITHYHVDHAGGILLNTEPIT